MAYRDTSALQIQPPGRLYGAVAGGGIFNRVITLLDIDPAGDKVAREVIRRGLDMTFSPVDHSTCFLDFPGRTL